MGRGLCSPVFPLLLVILLQCFVLYRSHAAPDISSVLNHNDLKEVMVHSLGPEGDACVRLLHRSGYIGCASPDWQVGVDSGIEGPLFPVKSLKSIDFIPNGAVAVVSANLAGQFLLQAASNRTLQALLAGILIQHSETFPGWNEASKNGYMRPKHDDPMKRSFDSSDETETESYHVWNPAGLNLVSLSFPFPVFLLDNVTSSLAISQADNNTIMDPESAAISLSASGPKHMARMHFNMEARTNSSVCLQERTCLPLGGFSVVSALPPLAASHRLMYDSPENSSTIWVVSSVDSATLFHRQTKGADAPLSGLIAMLAAARILGSNYRKENITDAFHPLDVDSNKRRRVVFAAVMGEPWGNMGSRRLLWESSIGSPSLLGLNISSAEALIEVGQVGRALQWNVGGDASASPESSTMNSDRGSVMQLYLHTGSMKKQSMQDRTRGVDALKRAFIDAGRESVSCDRFEISDASAGLEFPPPGIAEAFLKIRPELPALAITEFNTTFLNEAYSSTFDTLKTIDVASIVSCAEVLARSLHSLILMPSTPPADLVEDAMAPISSPGLDTKSPLDVNTTALEYYVKSLVECLVAPEPGLSCDLASRLMTPSAGPAQRSNYVGILRTVRQDPQTPDPNVQSDVERFLFSYMAFATSPDVSDAFDEGLDISSSFTHGDDTSPATEQHHEEISIPHTKTDAELRAVREGIGMPDLVVRDRIWCTGANATMCPSGTVCAGYRDVKGQKGYGVCLHATVRYVPAYSTGFQCQGCNGTDAWGAFNWTITSHAELW